MARDISQPLSPPAHVVPAMLSRLERMGNQLPPRLKALLNLAITVVLVLVAVPLLWAGVLDASWGEVLLGIGLALLGVFNLFT